MALRVRAAQTEAQAGLGARRAECIKWMESCIAVCVRSQARSQY